MSKLTQQSTFTLNELTTAVKHAYKDSAPKDPSAPVLNTNNWDINEQQYHEIAHMLVDISQQVGKLTKVPLLVNYMENPNEYRVLLNGFFEDLKKQAAVLADIHSQHEGRTGPVTDDDDNMKFLSIADLYGQFMVVYTSTVTPTFIQLMDIVNKATATLNEAAKKTSEETTEPAQAKEANNV